MANGKEPDCVTCLYYFRERLPDDKDPYLFKKIPRTIMCNLHKVFIPYDEITDPNVICPFWRSYKSGSSLYISLSHPMGFFIKQKILYSYTSVYTNDYKKVCDISDLPKLSEEDVALIRGCPRKRH